MRSIGIQKCQKWQKIVHKYPLGSESDNTEKLYIEGISHYISPSQHLPVQS